MIATVFISHRRVAAIAATLAAMAVLGPIGLADAAAPDKRVTLKNGTPSALVDFTSRRAGGGSWSRNIIAGRTVRPGASLTVDFGRGGHCVYDVRATFADNSSQITSGLDVCKVGELNYAK